MPQGAEKTDILSKAQVWIHSEALYEILQDEARKSELSSPQVSSKSADFQERVFGRKEPLKAA